MGNRAASVVQKESADLEGCPVQHDKKSTPPSACPMHGENVKVAGFSVRWFVRNTGFNLVLWMV